MYLPETNDPEYLHRRNLEVRIITDLVDRALANGYSLCVDDGGDEFCEETTDREVILNDIYNTDEDRLYYYKFGYVARVHLVYGNSGWDVINDYDMSLEDQLAPTLRLAQGLEG